MNGYDLYGIFQAVRLHFNSDTYNYFLYGGKTKIGIDTFEARRDKYLFHKLGRLYQDQDLVNFLVANFACKENLWIKELLEDESKLRYHQWMTRLANLEDLYTTDLKKFPELHSPSEFKNLFAVKNGDHPIVLQRFLQNEVCLETMVILNTLINYTKRWDAQIKDDIIYPKISKKIRKYGAFLPISVTKYSAITKSLLLGTNGV